MDPRLSDERLDRAISRLLAEQGAEIEARGVTPAGAAARVGTMPTLVHRTTVHRRFQTMNATLKLTVVAVLALAVGVGLFELGPADGIGGAAPVASPTSEPTELPSGPLLAGTYVTTPFAEPGSDACLRPPQASCIDGTDDDSIRITLTVPEGWEGSAPDGVATSADGGAALLFVRGASLAADPCHEDPTQVIPVGPSVITFARALRVHPLLSVTEATTVTLGGHEGQYVELQVPDDPTIQGSSQPGSLEGCPVYRPWNPWYLAQGPGELWHLWILDVDGVRVVVQAIDHADTSADVRAELQAIVDSVRIERPMAPAASAAPASLTWSPASLEQDWPVPVRPEPDGEPVLVPDDGGSRAYHDPTGDIGSSAPAWIDIETVNPDTSTSTRIGLAGSMPSPRPDPTEAWIAYGFVLDEDGDGVADVRLGVDNLPMGAGHRAWRTDLHTGRTESAVGPPYDGFHLAGHRVDTFYPEDFPGDHTSPAFTGGGSRSRFYAWASVIEDGKVVATDYAPDAGWLTGR